MTDKNKTFATADYAELCERLRARQSEYVEGQIVAPADYEALEASDAIEALSAKLADALELIENATQAASETHRSWKHRCYAVLAALGKDFGDPDFEIPDEPPK